MKVRKSLILLFGIMMVFWLAACSSDNTSTGKDNGSDGNKDNANGGEGEVTLRIAWWGDQTRP